MMTRVVQVIEEDLMPMMHHRKTQLMMDVEPYRYDFHL